MIAPHIDREFADAAVAGPVAVWERSREGDHSRFPGFGDHHQIAFGQPLFDLRGRAWLGLKGRDLIGDTFIVNRRNRRRVGGRVLSLVVSVIAIRQVLLNGASVLVPAACAQDDPHDREHDRHFDQHSDERGARLKAVLLVSGQPFGGTPD